MAEHPPEQPAGPAAAGVDPLAIAGLVFAFLFWPLGLVLSILGITRTGEGKRPGRGLAIAGVVVSCLGAFFLVLLVVLVMNTEPSVDSADALPEDAPAVAVAETDELEVVADEAAVEQAAADEAAEVEAAKAAAEEAAAAEQAAVEAAAAEAEAEEAAEQAAAERAAAEEAAQDEFGPQPDQQKAFVAHAAEAQAGWSGADNDLRRGALKAARDSAICETVPGLEVSGWTGKLTTIDANGDGKGVLGIEIAEDVEVKTWNNAFSDFMDETLIDPASPVFAAALEKSEGDIVTFGGEFVEENDGACIRESSLTLGGSVQDPEFIFRFSELS